MGVESTVTLTRKDAEDLYHLLILSIMRKGGVSFSDFVLEAALEDLNDAANGGEGFEKYIIAEAAQ